MEIKESSDAGGEGLWEEWFDDSWEHKIFI